MAHDVFISYSTKDKTISDAICAKLEENGIRTWIAPRDVPPGSNFAEAIVAAIDSCQVFVLIWSGNANASKHILNEINRAFDRGKPILPFRIQDVQPSSAMSYYLGNTHWLDAYEPSWENHLNKLIGSVSANLGIEPLQEKTGPVAGDSPPLPKKNIGLIQVLLGLAVIAILALASWYGLTRLNVFEGQSLSSSSTSTDGIGSILDEIGETPQISPTSTAATTEQENPTEEPGDDSCQIVFQSNRTGELNLWLINPDGKNQTQLSFNQNNDVVGSWSPDGTEFLFSSWRDGDGEIYLMEINGSNIRNLTDNDSSDFRGKLSPDGQRIAFYSDRIGNPEIFLMDLDGENVQQLTSDHGWYGTDYDYSVSPSLDWSPNSKSIVFVSDREENPEIFIIDLEGNDIQQLTFDGAVDQEPVWSPDGEQIVFISNRYGDYEIFSMKTDGTGLKQLTSNNGISAEPNWSPDGTKIAFVSDRTGDAEIWIMGADGSNQHQITFSEGYDGAPIWSPLCR